MMKKMALLFLVVSSLIVIILSSADTLVKPFIHGVGL
ncbi:hypothetical protein J2T12_003397 [Paenibacillus anaericanus]|nr:hypothetical protein [Paenibacillus anaericanus]